MERINFGKNEMAALSAEERTFLLNLKMKVSKGKKSAEEKTSGLKGSDIYARERKAEGIEKKTALAEYKTFSDEEKEEYNNRAKAENTIKNQGKVSNSPDGKVLNPETGRLITPKVKVQTIQTPEVKTVEVKTKTSKIVAPDIE
jgi:hypothetical protein